MKKIIPITLANILLLFVGSVIFSAAWGHLPALLAGFASSYKFNRAMVYFWTLLPAACFSGFMEGAAIAWKDQGNLGEGKRFSRDMIGRFKTVVIMGVIFALLLTLGNEVFLGKCRANVRRMAHAPQELEETLRLYNGYRKDGNYLMALEYARNAAELDPKNPATQAIFRQADDEKQLHEDVLGNEDAGAEKVTDNLFREIGNLTVPQLMERARDSYGRQDWINAHYWANLAVGLCTGTDTNLDDARRLRSEAWNMIEKTGNYYDPESARLYNLKKDAYAALNAGENLKAYYAFLQLYNEKGEDTKDPDIINYFLLAQQRMVNEYFFLDETQGLENYNLHDNVFFSITYDDQSRDVYSIGQVIKDVSTGGSISYLKDFTVASFNSDGTFRTSWHVPFAKMSSVSGSVLSMDRKFKTVPYIKLCSVDRQTEGIMSVPVFTDSLTGMDPVLAAANGFSVRESELPPAADREAASAGLKVSQDTMANVLVLPINFDELNLIIQNCNAESGGNVVGMFKFLKFCQKYGFAKEVYYKKFLSDILYPFFVLIFVVLCAAFTWKYRIVGKTLFKFVWILAFPVLMVLTYGIFALMNYVFSIIDLGLMAMFPRGVFVISILVYILILVGVSLSFISRKNN